MYANGVYSSYQGITQGVPQGSVLGPLLYTINANDLANVFKHCNIALYADDILQTEILRSHFKIYSPILHPMQSCLHGRPPYMTDWLYGGVPYQVINWTQVYVWWYRGTIQPLNNFAGCMMGTILIYI